jgi:hypothetical protein
MKKLLFVVSAVTLFSTSAFASQARLLALGMKETDNEGMYYIEDARNIFLNPAYVNLFPSYATVEFGGRGTNINSDISGATPSNATINQSNNTKAQGGIFQKMGDMVFGAYYGNESNTSSLLRIAGTSAAATLNGAGGGNSTMLQSADNQIDLFVGGDNGIKWGANALYAGGKNEAGTDSKDSAAAIRVGVIGSNWDAHLNLSVNSKAESTSVVAPLNAAPVTQTVRQEFEGKLGFQLGGSYMLGEKSRVFGYVKHYGWEQSDSYTGYGTLQAAVTGAGSSTIVGGQTGTVKGDFTSVYAGWATHMDVNNGDRVWTSLAVRKTDINLKFNTKAEVRHLVIPLTLAYEAKANEWLTLRGSIISNLWGRSDNKGYDSINPVARGVIGQIYQGNGKRTVAFSTEVNAGATLTYGQLNVDGLIGMTPGSRAATGTTTKNTGVLALDNLASSVAVTYKF